MWLHRTNRADLVNSIRSALRGELKNVESVDELSMVSIRQKELALIWEIPPEEARFLPNTIVIEDGSKRDFLAWVGTYIPSLRPFTRTCRIIEHSNFTQLINRNSLISNRRYVGAAIGLIISEAVSNQAVFRRRGSISYRDCLETFSYSFAKALFSGATAQELVGVSLAWVQAQKASRRISNASQNLEVLMGPWGTLLELCKHNFPQTHFWPVDPLVAKTSMTISEKGNISKGLQQKLAKSVSMPEKLFDLAKEGTRESRVVALEEALSGINKISTAKSNMAPFVAGYLVSLLEPGSLEFLSLSSGTSDTISEVTIWHGFLAGLHPNTNVFNSESGLGWNIGIELLRDFSFFDLPNIDMDIDEFELFTDSERTFTTDKSWRYGSLTIELVPGIETVVATRPNTEDNSANQRDLFEQERAWQETVHVIKDIEGAMRQLDYARSQLEKLGKRSDRSTRRSPNSKKY